MALKALCFTWNTESIPLCPDDNPSDTCEPNDYFADLAEKIKLEKPALVAFAYQEDGKPLSYFHSHYAPAKMEKIGYRLLARPRLMGLGKTTVKGLLAGRLVARGLRLSLYCHRTIPTTSYKIETSYYANNNLYSKGGIAIYITFGNRLKLAFINCHLDFNAKSLIEYRKQGNYIHRRSALAATNAGFNNMIEELVHKHDPTHVFVMGDLNYRLNHNAGAMEVAKMFLENQNNPDFLYNMYRRHDELRDQMIRQNIYAFEEGIDDKGPTFIPTTKMIKRQHDEVVSWGQVVNEVELENDEDIIGSFDLIEGDDKGKEEEEEVPSGWYNTFANTASTVGGVVGGALGGTYQALGSTASAVGGALGSTASYMTGTTSEAGSALPKDQLLRMQNGQINNESPSNRRFRINNPEHPVVPDHELGIQERDNRMWNTGKWDQRLPSWTDRILYGTVVSGKGEIICTYYNRFDRGNTFLLSDHAGVLGIYLITKEPADFISFRRELAPLNPSEIKVDGESSSSSRKPPTRSLSRK